MAARLAVARPGQINRLILAWPATAGDVAVDRDLRAGLTSRGAAPAVVDALLHGGALRGCDDAALATIRQPVGIVPSQPENPVHQRHTVDHLLRVIPGAIELTGSPEPPRSTFADHLDRFVATTLRFIGSS